MAASWSFHGTLVANTVQTVTLDQPYPYVRVTFRSPTASAAGQDIYFTTDGSTATVGGAGTCMCPAVFGATKDAKAPSSPSSSASSLLNEPNPIGIQLISNTGCQFTVEAVQR